MYVRLSRPYRVKPPVNSAEKTMPTAETLERFIARVEENAHAEACEEFYTEDSSMQENQAVPRVGRNVQVGAFFGTFSVPDLRISVSVVSWKFVEQE